MTPTEKFVSELCKETFLSFWSFPNPFGKSNKELCDILVVCEPDIIIFSVKEISIKESGNSDIDIDRWLRKAIDESVKQIYGAERIINLKEEILLKDGDTKIKLPKKEIRNIYRIAVAFGRGEKYPLRYGDFGKGHVHVFDEVSIQIILKELDTITDFINFLVAIEGIVQKNVKLLSCTLEDLLALYLTNGFDQVKEQTVISIDDNFWNEYSNSQEYLDEKRANENSFIWDGLIETLHNDFERKILLNPISREDLELSLRLMNSEPRSQRRQLSKLLMEVLGDGIVKPKVKSKIAKVDRDGSHAYVFLTGTHEERESRCKELSLRCFVARSIYKDSTKIIGIATEQYEVNKGFSIDLCYLDLPIWNDEYEKKADNIKKELGFFKSPTMSRLKGNE